MNDARDLCIRHTRRALEQLQDPKQTREFYPTEDLESQNGIDMPRLDTGFPRPVSPSEC